MRSGQPKCVCAPNCKAKNQRPKHGNNRAHAQLNGNHEGGLKRHTNDHSEPNRSDQNHRQSIQTDVDTSHYVQIFDHRNNQSHAKSDKIISIIAPIHSSSNPSNLSSSHRSKKIKLHNAAQQHNANRNMAKSTKHLVALNNSHAKQHPSGMGHTMHKPHKNEYSNSSSSSLFDNNILNVNHRRQTSVEEQFKSKFYGHDIPYPPIDLPVS